MHTMCTTHVIYVTVINGWLGKCETLGDFGCCVYGETGRLGDCTCSTFLHCGIWYIIFLPRFWGLGVCGETGRRGDWPSEDKSNCRQPSLLLTFHFQVIGEVYWCRGVHLSSGSLVISPLACPLSCPLVVPPSTRAPGLIGNNRISLEQLGSGQWPVCHYMVTCPGGGSGVQNIWPTCSNPCCWLNLANNRISPSWVSVLFIEKGPLHMIYNNVS